MDDGGREARETGRETVRHGCDRWPIRRSLDEDFRRLVIVCCHRLSDALLSPAPTYPFKIGTGPALIGQ